METEWNLYEILRIEEKKTVWNPFNTRMYTKFNYYNILCFCTLFSCKNVNVEK